jgi:hypothetical protein
MRSYASAIARLYRWPNFFYEEVDQQTCCSITDGLGHIFSEIALDRGNGVSTHVLGKFDGHVETSYERAYTPGTGTQRSRSFSTLKPMSAMYP